MLEAKLTDLGYQLKVNPSVPKPGIYAIDIETDESDKPNFVGLGLSAWSGPKVVYYFSQLTPQLKECLERSHLIGHNVKSDIKWLRGWGCKIKAAQIYHDSMIMAYSRCTTEENYGLKKLAEKELGWKWPSYREMVGKGKAKKTLDKQEVERVANYCGMDTAASLELCYLYLERNKLDKRVSAPNWLKYYYQIELPIYRLLLDMETEGIRLDVSSLSKLDGSYQQIISTLERQLTAVVPNPNSPKQILEVLFPRLGIREKSTGAKVLKRYAEKHEIIKTILQYRKYTKLQGTYTGAFLSLSSLPMVHSRFNQVSYNTSTESSFGIRTGRLSCSEPNLQNIPSHGQDGDSLRSLFIPRESYLLYCADYSQIEYRLLAHFSQEPVLLKAFEQGKDAHAATAQVIYGLDEITKEQRNIGKTVNFAAIYGAQARKVAETTGLSEEECQTFLDSYFAKLPRVTSWITRTKFKAHSDGGVTTLFGRFIPLPGLKSRDRYEKWHWERAAVNYIIQGSAAEVIKLAMLRVQKVGFLPSLTVHDELLFEIRPSELKVRGRLIKSIMEHIVYLSAPLVVDAGSGKNWCEAKGAS